MSKHTPEPWDVKELRGDFFVSGPATPDHPYAKQIKHIEILSDDEYPRKEADARRIVACVNACAGIPTEELESGSKIIADYEKLQRQNAELLEALEKPINTPNTCNRHGGYGFVSDCVVCKAVAKAKGEV